MKKKSILPELLAPAGSPTALKAAIEAGADAVYMGGISFNARINAKNFTADELSEGIRLAHAYGTKVYIAANTLIFDREREDFLRAAEQVYLMGADALIVADVGMARELKKRIPIELHASTQLSGHNVEAAKALADAGFSRMVCAREMPREDIAEFCKSSPIEAEVFVHGALCVSASGQCLFSSMVGGRSGNRGECAQPCRLPYSVGGKQCYPLSLKDLSLAQHITELCDMGVASFKIEGRMKAPEYVRDVTRIWRRLLDEGRNADKSDMAELERIFSRGGSTDGYYSQKIGRGMLGVRSQSDKDKSAELTPFDKLTRKIPLSFDAKIRLGEPITLRAVSGNTDVTVEGQVPEVAINAPLSNDTVSRNLSKLGGTPYELTSLALELDENVMLPISALNALRRAAVDALGNETGEKRSEADFVRNGLDSPEKNNSRGKKTAVFYDSTSIPEAAYSFFDEIFIPLEQYTEKLPEKVGVMLPEVVLDSQLPTVEKMLDEARKKGAKSSLVGNIGHISLAQRYGFEVFGDFRLNVMNSSSAAALQSLGINEFVLSPELSLAQMRDIGAGSAVVYGRIPLMLTEKCIGKEIGGCEKCKSGSLTLTDRRGVSFPVLRRFEHRSAIFNSVPVYMADRATDLKRARLNHLHFIFTTESRAEADLVIRNYIERKSTDKAIKRIK